MPEATGAATATWRRASPIHEETDPGRPAPAASEPGCRQRGGVLRGVTHQALLTDERHQHGRRERDVDGEPDPGDRLGQPALAEGECVELEQRGDERERGEGEGRDRDDPRALPARRAGGEAEREGGAR